MAHSRMPIHFVEEEEQCTWQEAVASHKMRKWERDEGTQVIEFNCINLRDDILDSARNDSFETVLDLLVASPEQWHGRDADRHSLLHWAAMSGSEDFIGTALSQKCQVDAEASNQQTPLMWALAKGHVGVVRQLIDAEADVNMADSLGATPLIIAVQHTSHTRYQLMLVLMQRGGQEVVSHADDTGCTSAHWAAYMGDVTALKLLTEFKADLQSRDFSMMTPLHRAVYVKQESVIPHLLQCRCDPWERMQDGRNCFAFAEDNQAILALLRGDSTTKERGEPSAMAWQTDIGTALTSWFTPSSAMACFSTCGACDLDLGRFAMAPVFVPTGRHNRGGVDTVLD